MSQEHSVKLQQTFNVVLVCVFSLGLVLAGVLSYSILIDNAREEVVERAGIMMEAAQAIRSYTVQEVRPLLAAGMAEEFLPQTVPAYAAHTNFRKLRKAYPDYAYKEAALNPTNPADRAADWEADVIEYFRANPDAEHFFGERKTPTGQSLYFSRPIWLRDAACLACHSVASAAPATMLARYGNANGFGWQLGDIVAAQIVSVPMSVPLKKAHRMFFTFMATLAGIFVAIMVALNILLRRMVVVPLGQMSKRADSVSLGELDTPEFEERGPEEISNLAASFNRMRRSLVDAMRMLEEEE